MSNTIKITGSACSYVLEQLAKLPADTDFGSKEFLDVMELEARLKGTLELVRSAVEKIGYAAEDTNVFNDNLNSKDELSKDVSNAIARHTQMIELSNEARDIEGLPKDFKIPKCGLDVRRLLYDLMIK